MRRATMLMLAIAAVAATAMPSGAAETVTVRHAAPVPCAAACPHWDPASMAGFHPCSNQFPPGSYDKTLFTFTSTTGVIRFEAHSDVEYHTTACTNTTPSRNIRIDDHHYGACDRVLGRTEVPVGCTVIGEISRDAIYMEHGGVNYDFWLVSYNWTDVGAVNISLNGPVAVVDDRFNPLPL